MEPTQSTYPGDVKAAAAETAAEAERRRLAALAAQKAAAQTAANSTTAPQLTPQQIQLRNASASQNPSTMQAYESRYGGNEPAWGEDDEGGSSREEDILRQRQYQLATQGTPSQYTIQAGKGGKTEYDIQRERAEAASERERQRSQEALKGRLVGQGIEGGLALRQQFDTDAQVREALQRRLTDVDLEELQARERGRETEGQRRFLTGERLGAQDFGARQSAIQRRYGSKESAADRTLSREGLGLQEKLGLGGQALQRRGQDISVSEAEKGRTFDRQSQAIQNAFQGELAKMSIGVQLKQLAQQAGQFKTEAEFKKYAFDKGIDQEEAARAWQTSEAAMNRAQQTSERVGSQLFETQEANRDFGRTLALTANSQTFQKDMALLGNQLTQGNLTLQDTIADNNLLQKQTADSYYEMGLAGKQLDEKALIQLKSNNPGAYAMYQSGLAGESKDNADAKNDLIMNTYQAAIVGLNPDDPQFRNQLTSLANSMSTQLGYGNVFAGAGGAASPSNPNPPPGPTNANGSADSWPTIENPTEGQVVNSDDGTVWTYKNGQWTKAQRLGGYPTLDPNTLAGAMNI